MHEAREQAINPNRDFVNDADQNLYDETQKTLNGFVISGDYENFYYYIHDAYVEGMKKQQKDAEEAEKRGGRPDRRSTFSYSPIGKSIEDYLKAIADSDDERYLRFYANVMALNERLINECAVEVAEEYHSLKKQLANGEIQGLEPFAKEEDTVDKVETALKFGKQISNYYGTDEVFASFVSL